MAMRDVSQFTGQFKLCDGVGISLDENGQIKVAVGMGQSSRFFKTAAKCVNRHKLGQALLQMQKKARSVHTAIVSQLKLT